MPKVTVLILGWAVGIGVVLLAAFRIVGDKSP
jgi:hypothetical protein